MLIRLYSMDLRRLLVSGDILRNAEIKPKKVSQKVSQELAQRPIKWDVSSFGLVDLAKMGGFR